MQHLPVEIAGGKVIAVCLEKEILFYDLANCALISSLNFRYTQVRAKLLEKE